MFEVLEKKKLELNEKVDFSLAPVSEAEEGFIRQYAGASPLENALISPSKG